MIPMSVYERAYLAAKDGVPNTNMFPHGTWEYHEYEIGYEDGAVWRRSQQPEETHQPVEVK